MRAADEARERVNNYGPDEIEELRKRVLAAKHKPGDLEKICAENRKKMNRLTRREKDALADRAIEIIRKSGGTVTEVWPVYRIDHEELEWIKTTLELVQTVCRREETAPSIQGKYEIGSLTDVAVERSLKIIFDRLLP